LAPFEKVLKDPIHDEIVVTDPWIWRIINTRAMQRLRRIRQLGTSFLTFHGAEHSRFTHSLGAYEIMRRTLIHLEQDCGWPSEVRDRRLALASALLHDVGHGPFSHTFEKVYPVHHEVWTRKIILEDKELSECLAEIDNQFGNDLVGIFQKTNGYTYIQQLISSQLDVDRMDYLLRDAIHTGVSYGRFEIARIIRSLTLENRMVLLKSSALRTVEQYILARYFMYTQVYLHPVTVGSDVLVGQILSRARDLVESGHSVFVPRQLSAMLGAETGGITVDDYLWLDESTLLYAFSKWAKSGDAVLEDLSDRFLTRKLFVPLIRSEPSREEWAALRTVARANGFDPNYYVAGRSSSISGYVYLGEGITLIQPDGELTELSRESRLVRELVPDEEFRLFLPKELLEVDKETGGRIESIVSKGKNEPMSNSG
jgi:uncharacterized protein